MSEQNKEKNQTGLFLRGEYRGYEKVMHEDANQDYIKHSIETIFESGKPKTWHVKDKEGKFKAERGEIIEIKVSAQAGIVNGHAYLIYKIPEENQKLIKSRNNNQTSDVYRNGNYQSRRRRSFDYGEDIPTYEEMIGRI